MASHRGRNAASVASFAFLIYRQRKDISKTDRNRVQSLVYVQVEYKEILKDPVNICWTKKTGFFIMETSEDLCECTNQNRVQMHRNFDGNR